MQPLLTWIAGTTVGLAVLALATWAHVRFWTRRLTFGMPYDEVLEVPTTDGTYVELRRLRNEGTPVLLVHGVAMNHRNNDLREDASLARHLHRAGRDVWLVTLRSGRRAGRVPGEVVDFEHIARFDLPAAIGAVAGRTRSVAIDYVGFSMGGMLLYAALGRSVPEVAIRKAVLIGSPGKVRAPWLATVWLRLLPRALFPTVRLRWISRAVAFIAEPVVTPIHGLFANGRNFAKGITRASLVNAIEDIPGKLAADFYTWSIDDGELRVGADRGLTHLWTIRTPALFFAGGRDRVAPPGSVRHAADAWGKEHGPPRFVELSERNGATVSYGHADLAFGKHAPHDVFEPVREFLAD